MNLLGSVKTIYAIYDLRQDALFVKIIKDLLKGRGWQEEAFL
jgi:hypothetical protein